MKIDFEQKPEYFAFASRVLDVNFTHDGGCKSITSLHNNGDIAAVAIYSRFHEHNLEMSVASDGSGLWMSKTFLLQAFAYPFLVLGKRRVMAVMEEGNHQAINLNRRLGFVREGLLRKWYGDKDGILVGMLREECKWLKLAERNTHV